METALTGRLKEESEKLDHGNLECAVKLVGGETSRLAFTGSREFKHRAKRIANDLDLLLKSIKDPNKACPVCTETMLEGSDQSFTLNCSYWYHGSCLIKHALDSLTTGSMVPLKCCAYIKVGGLQGPGIEKCGKRACIDDMAILRELLTQVQLQELHSLSLGHHVRINSASLQFRPTPKCKGVYRTTKVGCIHICTVCLQPTCTSCKVVHWTQTCEEYQESVIKAAYGRSSSELGDMFPQLKITVEQRRA